MFPFITNCRTVQNSPWKARCRLAKQAFRLCLSAPNRRPTNFPVRLLSFTLFLAPHQKRECFWIRSYIRSRLSLLRAPTSCAALGCTTRLFVPISLLLSSGLPPMITRAVSHAGEQRFICRDDRYQTDTMGDLKIRCSSRQAPITADKKCCHSNKLATAITAPKHSLLILLNIATVLILRLFRQGRIEQSKMFPSFFESLPPRNVLDSLCAFDAPRIAVATLSLFQTEANRQASRLN